nr:DUF397 domain-containing protein [Nocardia carnea]
MTVTLPDAQWFKSSHSGTRNECVEVAWLSNAHVGVRDSKHRAGPALIFSDTDWTTFTRWLRTVGSVPD